MYLPVERKADGMAAFERVKSGIPGMDKCLDNIRLGDNVVWRVSDLDQFRHFMLPYVDQAIQDGRNVIYVRFAEHPPLLEPRDGLKIVKIDLSYHFETFTVQIHNLITEEGRDAFYVFDCLSSLQTAWATDLMMGAFFRLTCPYLFTLDTVAYFPVLRGRHSYDTIAVIKDTTQLFIDVYSSEDNKDVLYFRPIKVWNRYLPEMFLPHLYKPSTGEFKPLTDAVQVSDFYRRMNNILIENDNQTADSWHRFFQSTKILWENGIDVTEACGRMCEIMLTRDLRLQELIKKNFKPDDYFNVSSHMIGTGLIGGKATGMLLSRKLVENQRPDIYSRLEPHDSYYVGSDVFYTYLVNNDLWDLHLKQREEEGYFTLAGEMRKGILNGKFTPSLKDEFVRLLDYYGQDPIIVRSSSIQEDAFGNVFAGKYESVFCSNSGTPEERLQEFENAVRTVYASTMGLSALDYRRRRGLDKVDEQMALLVQRVSGMRRGSYFLPCAAGVGYSVSPYSVSGADRDGGMLRLVMGLGTAAVDRNGTYPRIVPLSDPQRQIYTSDAERQHYSQQEIDAVNTSTGAVEGLYCDWAAEHFSRNLAEMLMSHNRETERMLRERGQRRYVYYVSCDGLVRNEQLMADMRDILKLLMENYSYPVDIEFTINLAPDSDEYVIDLLQCRPLQQSGSGAKVTIPENLPDEKVFLRSRGASMGLSRVVDLDYLVVIDPVAYYRMPYNDKYNVRDAVGRINWYFRGQGRHLMLLAPGRICTSSPELGVPTTFADISEFDIIGEVEETRAGYLPELSYGSHIFQDLVEARILYTAVFSGGRTETYRPELFAKMPEFENSSIISGGGRNASVIDEENMTGISPGVSRLAGSGPSPESAAASAADGSAAGGTDLHDIVKIYDAKAAGCRIYYDMISGELAGVLCGS